MKIELELPFKDKWRSGYLQIHPSGRKYVCLFNTRKDRSLISYARYLLSVQLGRNLTKDEFADHKDEDKTNDEISNLQVLTREENNRKSREWQEKNGRIHRKVILDCPVCLNTFTKSVRAVSSRLKHRKPITCSTACSKALRYGKGI